MYKYVLFVIIIIFIISLVVFLVTSHEKIHFDSKTSDNFQNVVGYKGSYNGKDVIIDKTLQSITYEDKTYNHKSNGIYASKHMLTTKKHLFYYIDEPIMGTQQINKEHNIPKIIWQTTKQPLETDNPLNKAIDTFRNQKGWKHNMVYDKDGREFLQENFEPKVVHAFDALVPGAYKADLLRACLLYIHGGVYADAKLKLHYNLDSFLENDIVLVNEFSRYPGIWNGFMASVPKHRYFKEVIDAIVDNVSVLYNGDTPVSITGPRLYGKIFDDLFENNTPHMLNCRYFLQDKKRFINLHNNQEMFISWPYSRQYRKNLKSADYAVLWKTKKVYDKKLHKINFPELKEFEFLWSKGLKHKTKYMLAPTESKSSNFDTSKDIIWVRMGSSKNSDIKRFAAKIKNIKQPKILVTSDGDLSIPSGLGKKFVDTIINCDNIKAWYTQNYDGTLVHPKLKPYPIGLDLHTFRLGLSEPQNRVNKMFEIRRSVTNKLDYIFCDVQHTQNHKFGNERKRVNEILSGKQFMKFLEKRQSQIKIWENYSKHKFVISTHGNGLDCHRTWEILLLGSIVVTKTSSLDPLFENLPVVIVSDWNECNTDNMKIWYEKYKDMLTEEYIRPFFIYNHWIK